MGIYIEISEYLQEMRDKCPTGSQVNLHQEFILNNIEQFRRMC